MKIILNEFLHKLTFERQLGILVTLGILLLALSSALVGSWQSNERIRNRLTEQGQRITENLAHQSALALIYSTAENADAAVNATLTFPGVVSVEIIDINQHSLVSRGRLDAVQFPKAGAHTNWNNNAAISMKKIRRRGVLLPLFIPSRRPNHHSKCSQLHPSYWARLWS